MTGKLANLTLSNGLPFKPSAADWCCFYLSHYFSLPFSQQHEETFNLVDDESIKRACIRGPRLFGKSIPISFGYPLYCICERPSVNRLMIISETSDLAKHWVREIKNELETNQWILSNPKYGDMKTEKWTEDHFICKRPDGSKIEIKAKSYGAQIRGFHPQILIVDDAESLENTNTEDQRKKVRNWFNRDVINVLAEDDPDARLLVIGTRLHPLSLLTGIFDRPGWVCRRFVAINPDGTSIWPEKWPIDALKRRRADIGTIAFNAEFMDEPIVSENPVFFKQWFKGYTEDSALFQGDLKKGLYTVAFTDPAISNKDSADYTAIVTVSATFDKDTRFYIRPGGVIRGHWPINQQVSQVVDIHDKFKCKAVGFETVAYQEALAQEFRRFMRDHRRHVQVIEIKPDKDKERRAHAVAPYFERGQVYIDFSDKNSSTLLDECIMFPTGDRDDYVDALVYAMSELINWSQRKGVGQIKSALDSAGW